MRILYSVINFLILAAVLYFVGRKLVFKMFAARREAIATDLQRAQSGHDALAQAQQSVRKLEEQCVSELEEIRVKQDKTMEQSRQSIQREAELAQEKQRLRLEDELEIYRRTMARETEKTIVSEIVQTAARDIKVPDGYERACAVRIAQRVTESPGDTVTLMGKKPPVKIEFTGEPDVDLAAMLLAAVADKYGVQAGDIPLSVVTVPELMGGIRLTVNDTVYDTSINNALRNVEIHTHLNISADTEKSCICQAVEGAIDSLDLGIEVYQVGRVLSVSDGICHISGLSDAVYGEMVKFDGGVRGMVLDLEREYIGCIIFGKFEAVEEGDTVYRSGYVMDVPVGEALLGRVVDALGKPIDGKGIVSAKERRPIEAPAPGIPDRKSVSVPLQTGIKAIDALVPIGRGQRELIIGDRQTGKTSIAVDTIINQRDKGVICIYVAIGQKETTVANIKETLTRYDAMDYTVIVCADAFHSAPMQYIAPYAGTAMGEYFMQQGKDVLIIFDDLSKHAVAYREISLLLHRPSGREAYPGDVFYLHSRLLERSARLSEAAGGGSMTALPIIETQAGDISAYIPTNVISITDGQIFLESELFHQGQRPAVNVGLSVSRVGGSAQIGAMRQISGRLRMDLAQFRELAAFSQFGSDLDEATKSAIAKGERLMALLRQNQHEPVPAALQVAAIFALSEGYADDMAPEDIAPFEAGLRTYLSAKHQDVLDEIASGKKMTQELMDRLRAAIAGYKESAV